MRQSLTAVLERNTTLRGAFETEPYEAAWAGEGRWFLQVLKWSHPEASIVLKTQISPDGLVWCDFDETERRIDGAPLTSWPVAQFGQWLRIKGEVTPADASAKVRIYLAMKS